MTNLVDVQNIGVRFGGLQAIHDASLTVRPGEIHALIGPNGAGKSTLVNCITGYQQLSSGSVLVRGRDIRGYRPARIASSGVARTFQTPQLFGRLSVAGNVALALRSGAARELRDLLEGVGLTAKQDVAASELPYGQQRLLELARALACRPALLLVDEPAAGLSAPEQDLLSDALRAFTARADNGVLIIEHNVTLVRNIADRISVLHQGMMIASGDPESVLTDQEVIEAYLGSSGEAAAVVS